MTICQFNGRNPRTSDTKKKTFGFTKLDVGRWCFGSCSAGWLAISWSRSVGPGIIRGRAVRKSYETLIPDRLREQPDFQFGRNIVAYIKVRTNQPVGFGVLLLFAGLRAGGT